MIVLRKSRAFARRLVLPAEKSQEQFASKIPVAGLALMVVSSGGDLLKTSLSAAPGAGAPNPACGEFTPKKQDRRRKIMDQSESSFDMVDSGCSTLPT